MTHRKVFLFVTRKFIKNSMKIQHVFKKSSVFLRNFLSITPAKSVLFKVKNKKNRGGQIAARDKLTFSLPQNS